MKVKTQFIVLAIILLFKTVQVLYLGHLLKCSNSDFQLGKISFLSGDTFSYTGAMENLISNGIYSFNNGVREVLAGRLPHYSIPYWGLRQFLTIGQSYDVFVILQMIIESLSILLLFNMAVKWIKIKFASLLLILLLLNLQITHYAFSVIPESLSASFLIIFACFYVRYQETQSLKILSYAGFFLGLLVCLKPYFGILYPFIGLQLLSRIHFRIFDWTGMRFVLTRSLVVGSFLILLLTPWVIRNYIVLDRIIFLQENSTAGYNYTSADFAYRRFVTAWAGDFVFWEKTSAGCYFEPLDAIPCEFTFPKRAFTDGYNMNDLEQVKQLFIEYKETRTMASELKAAQAFERLTKIYSDERPLDYYLVNRVVLIWKFISNSGSYYLPIHTSNPCYNPWQMVIKIMQSLFYWMSLIFGFLGLLLLSVKHRRFLVLLFIPLSLLILFPVVFGSTEWRFFHTPNLILLFGMVYLLKLIFQKSLQRVNGSQS